MNPFMISALAALPHSSGDDDESSWQGSKLQRKKSVVRRRKATHALKRYAERAAPPSARFPHPPEDGDSLSHMSYARAFAKLEEELASLRSLEKNTQREARDRGIVARWRLHAPLRGC